MGKLKDEEYRIETIGNKDKLIDEFHLKIGSTKSNTHDTFMKDCESVEIFGDLITINPTWWKRQEI